MRPAEGPPTSATWMSTSNGAAGWSSTEIPSSDPSRPSGAGSFPSSSIICDR